MKPMTEEQVIRLITEQLNRMVKSLTDKWEAEIKDLKRTIELQATEIKILKEGANL